MNHKKPSITVDGIIIKDNKILLIKRRNNPFKNNWALPGGFVEYNEKCEDAVVREIKEETNLDTKIIRLFGVYSDPERDPRGHTISVIYLLKIVSGKPHSGDDAKEIDYFSFENLPKLSFDHDKIIQDLRREI